MNSISVHKVESYSGSLPLRKNNFLQVVAISTLLFHPNLAGKCRVMDRLKILSVFFNSIAVRQMHFFAGRMNREVMYWVAVFVVGCVAITFRAIVFNLAGERFVARLRKQVSNQLMLLILLLVLYLEFSFFQPSSSKKWDSLTKIGKF